MPGVLAVVPARGGSKGLPGKNLLPLAGVPLLVHSLRFAAAVPSITRCIVSTDDPAIAAVACEHGAEVPFLRPAELAADDTPMAPVLRHAVDALGQDFDAVVLLTPTMPVRRVADVSAAIALLPERPDVDGVISVSEPPFNPLWVGVRAASGGTLARFFPDAAGIVRRQDAPRYLRINGVFYVWRTGFVRRMRHSWFDEGRHVGYEIDDAGALDIDTAADYERITRLVEAGIVELPS